MIIVVPVHAQKEVSNYKPFKVTAGIGGLYYSFSGLNGGALLAIEPKYAVKEKFLIGLRMEGAALSNRLISTANGYRSRNRI